MSAEREAEEMELLEEGNQPVAVETGQAGGEGNSNMEMVLGVEPVNEDEDMKEELLDCNELVVVSEVQQDSSCAVNQVVEDALEKTINEVAETSLASAAIEGEDPAALNSRRRNKYDWDAPIVKDIIRRVKNHKLSHTAAAEQLSLLMDAQVTSIGVRLEVLKMANDEAHAKQNQQQQQQGVYTRSARNPKASSSRSENQFPVSGRTRSKTIVNQKRNRTRAAKQEYNMEVQGQPQTVEDASNIQSTANMDSSNTTTLLIVKSDPSNPSNTPVYMPVITSQQPTSPGPAVKSIPPLIRLLDNEGKLTHIAVAENGSYKVYRVNEGNPNAENISVINQTITTDVISTSTESSMNIASGPSEHQAGTTMQVENVSQSNSDANYFIESVPAQQTLGALVGIPKFVNPERYGGSTVYTRTYGPDGSFQCSGVWRSRNEIREEAKRLIRCVKSQHISCDQGMKELYKFAELNIASNTPSDEKLNDSDESKLTYDSSIAFETSLQRDGGEDGSEPYTRLVDEQGIMNIAIAEDDGYRVYRLNRITENQELYRCADCDSLYRTKRDPLAIITIIDGILYGDAHPLHHARCPLQALSVKECDQDLEGDENELSSPQEVITICEPNLGSDGKELSPPHEAVIDMEEGRTEGAARTSAIAKRSPKKSPRKNRQENKSESGKKPRVVPERTLGMTLRKRKTRTLTSPGFYDSEVMS